MAKSTSKLFENETPTEMQEDAMNLPEEMKENEEAANAIVDLAKRSEAPADDIQDIDISAIKKKRFRINGDNNKILELNTSDLNIATRMETAYNRLVALMDDVGKVLSSLPEEDAELSESKEFEINNQLKKIDAEMRQELDYIFDAPVSEVCSDGGSMYDPFDGMFRFEHIMDAISKLYETNINSEFNAMRKRVSAKTSKYTKKYHN